jgi:hypothetical protein
MGSWSIKKNLGREFDIIVEWWLMVGDEMGSFFSSIVFGF